MSRYRIRSVALVFLLLAICSAWSLAQKQTVTFGKLKNLEFIDQFYNGGTGSQGSGPGPNFGLTFTTNAQAIISASQGGSGNFINNPGKFPVMFFQTGSAVTMTAASGLQNAILLYYSALKNGNITVYAGPNATGNILASVNLPANNVGCNTYKLCVWSPVGVPLSAPAGSVSFQGVADNLAIGTIHLGVPLPTSMVLTSSQNPSGLGESVTFTAAVTATGAVAAGNVTFKAGTQVVGTVPLSGGVATITLSSLKTGSTRITAKFQGTGFNGVTRGLVQVVN